MTNEMQASMLSELAVIRDQLLEADEHVCAAYVQMAIDLLESRAPNSRAIVSSFG